MRDTFFSLFLLSLVAASVGAFSQPAEPNRPECALIDIPPDQLRAWRENAFAEQLTDAAARDFASCLGHPSPFLRDQIGYEGFTAALRSGQISEATRRDLIAALSQNLVAEDPSGLRAPFSALGLAELARTDRVAPFLAPTERTALVDIAAAYLTGVTDYRAYTIPVGWRHGVAHGADFAMQLALNSKVDPSDLLKLKQAITAQIGARSGHAYTFGEPERLARPIYFIAQRGVISESDWIAWFTELAAPAPLESWTEAFQSEQDLARLHNLKAFARVLYINASLSDDEALAPIADGALELLKALP